MYICLEQLLNRLHEYLISFDKRVNAEIVRNRVNAKIVRNR